MLLPDALIDERSAYAEHRMTGHKNRQRRRRATLGDMRHDQRHRSLDSFGMFAGEASANMRRHDLSPIRAIRPVAGDQGSNDDPDWIGRLLKERFPDRADIVLKEGLCEGDHDRVLGRKVIVDAADAHARFGGDRRRRQALRAIASQNPSGRLEDRVDRCTRPRLDRPSPMFSWGFTIGAWQRVNGSRREF